MQNQATSDIALTKIQVENAVMSNNKAQQGAAIYVST